MKSQPRKWGKSICVDMKLIFKIHKDLTQPNSKKKKKKNQKNYKR